MAVFAGEMEALTVEKWPMAVYKGERERERVRMAKKEKEAHVLMLEVKITDGLSVGNQLMKRFVSLI